MATQEVPYQQSSPAILPIEVDASILSGLRTSESIFESGAPLRQEHPEGSNILDIHSFRVENESHERPDNDRIPLSITVEEFGLNIRGEVVNVESTGNYESVVLECLIDVGVRALLSLRTERLRSGSDALQIAEANLHFDVNEHIPRNLFIVDNLYALLTLADAIRVSIPTLKIELVLRFSSKLPGVADLFQRKELYFALMAIEKSFDAQFHVPEYVSGDEMSAIFFAFRAIASKNFIWRVNSVTLPTPATSETWLWFNNLKSVVPNKLVYRMMFGPTPVRRAIFGKEFSLGDQTLFIEDGVIENHDEVRKALARRDGNTVLIHVKPLSRSGRYHFSGQEFSRSISWDGKVEQLLKVAPSLTQKLISKYFFEMSLANPEIPPEQILASIEPQTVSLLLERAKDEHMPVDVYLRSLLISSSGASRAEDLIELMPLEEKKKLFRFIGSRLRFESPTQPHSVKFSRSKRGFPISKGRARFTSADVERIESES